jgi:sugar phosphate isomerase/epimerase
LARDPEQPEGPLRRNLGSAGLSRRRLGEGRSRARHLDRHAPATARQRWFENGGQSWYPNGMTTIRVLLLTILTGFLCAMAQPASESKPAGIPPSRGQSLFAPANLLAWCIVPYDQKNRTPAERIAMLQRLGFTQYVWDWRQQHLKDLPEEIRLARENGIRLRAVWLWIDAQNDRVGRLSDANRAVIDAVTAAHLSVEFWVGINANFFESTDEAGRVRRGAAMVAYLRDQVAASGSTIALYNHGDWFGEPENEIKILQAAGDPSVGMVFNFHHAHPMIDAFPRLLPRMLPHLRAVNLNGMRPEGPKILPIGQGTREREMIRLLQQSGYAGPIGILGHVEDADVEVVLRRNLEGLRALVAGEATER